MDSRKEHCRKGESDATIMLAWLIVGAILFYGVIILLILYYS